MFVRIHKLPKKFWKACCSFGELSPKARYYREQSLARYLKDENQRRLYEAITTMKPEIGRIENVRFIVSDNL